MNDRLKSITLEVATTQILEYIHAFRKIQQGEEPTGEPTDDTMAPRMKNILEWVYQSGYVAALRDIEEVDE